MEDWVIVKTIYSSEIQARKAAQVITVTESRLVSAERGAQYDIETEVAETPQGWQVRWRKVLVGYGSGGCGGCGSCQGQDEQARNEAAMGKVLLFKPRNREIENI